ncbi:MAG TPA: D-aminoacylase [Bryobacteraceae bacterium]|nr:D-aminoacylase [Bryobacteraceae bacterium]
MQIFDGTGAPSYSGSVAVDGDTIAAVGDCGAFSGRHVVNGGAHALAPGFIDVHTHDDLSVITKPDAVPKLSQGVTTVIVGNCGISAAPVRLPGDLPDPMNLLGEPGEFRYPTLASYVAAINNAQPSVNVAALAGHTALRNNHLDRLDRAATPAEIDRMRADLREALAAGAIGLSTGLAYLSAFSATTEEILALAEPLSDSGAVYATHLRSETGPILDAMDEAFRIGRHARVPVVISHLKCAGIDNWGRSGEVLQSFETAREYQPVNGDCYPYAAGSSTLDLRQVDERVRIVITWSKPFSEMAGKTLHQIAELWRVSQLEAAKRLQPAGAIYHSISEDDMRRFLQHPATMIGSDGLPNDPLPHPRLWGTFPRVLGHYSRDLQLFPLTEALRKMTSLPAARFNIANRGQISQGFKADLVLFDAATILDTATFEHPQQPAKGLHGIWVNGVLSYSNGAPTGQRAGRFLKRPTK